MSTDVGGIINTLPVSDTGHGSEVLVLEWLRLLWPKELVSVQRCCQIYSLLIRHLNVITRAAELFTVPTFRTVYKSRDRDLR
jgi:hypothetical protein